VVRDGHSWASCDKRLPLPVEQGIGNDSGEPAPHQRSALAWPYELLAGNGEEELEKIAIQIGIASLTKRLGWCAADLAPHCFERREILLKARQRARKLQSMLVAAKCFRVAANEARQKPRGWLSLLCSGDESGRGKRPDRFS